jgi:hypothetical protein
MPSTGRSAIRGAQRKWYTMQIADVAINYIGIKKYCQYFVIKIKKRIERRK